MPVLSTPTAAALAAAGVVLGGLLGYGLGRSTSSAAPVYNSLAGCIVEEMRGRQELMYRVTVDYCWEKVKAGTIAK